MKDIVRLNILWTWIKIRANSFIKTLANIVQRKSTTMSWKLSHLKKNATLHFKEHCSEIDNLSLVVIRFFFSQTNLVFESNPLFIDILDSFSHSFFLRISKFIRCLYTFFIKTSKVLMSFNVLFVRLQLCQIVIMSYFQWKILMELLMEFLWNMELLLTAKITPDVDNYLLLVNTVQALRGSLHVRQNFWCLIIFQKEYKWLLM